MTGYDRSALFGPRWSDDIDVPSGHNGCDQRSDIIRRQLANLQLKPGTRGCVPLSGNLRDPYTGQVIAFVRGPSTSDDGRGRRRIRQRVVAQGVCRLITSSRSRESGALEVGH